MALSAVTVIIGGASWQFWQNLSISRHIDNFATITFTGPFDATRRQMREVFRPFAFQPVIVKVDGEDVFHGTMLTPMPHGEPDKLSIDVSAYAKPAVLMDTNLPVSSFPVEWNGLTLGQIASAVCEPYGLEATSDVPLGPAFKRVKMDPDKAPGAFLADLARQRGKVLRDDAAGRLLITESSKTGRPVAVLKEGEAPLISAMVTFSPQDYFSEITGLVKGKAARRGGKHTIANPFLPAVVRPQTFSTSDSDPGDLPSAVAAKLGRMFGNMVSYVVKVPTWKDESGNLWTPDTTISLEAPSAMVYSPYEFLIRDVILVQDGDSEDASLGLVMPGAFSGDNPASMPWD